MEIKTLNLKLKTIEKDTPDTVLLTFELNEELEFTPGQFMMIEGVIGEERKSINTDGTRANNKVIPPVI